MWACLYFFPVKEVCSGVSLKFLICIFLMIKDVKHVFFLFAINISSVVKYLFRSSTYFILLSFWLLSCKNSLHILIEIFYQICVSKYFLIICGLFLPLKGRTCKFHELKFPNFFVHVYDVCIHLRNLCLAVLFQFLQLVLWSKE